MEKSIFSGSPGRSQVGGGREAVVMSFLTWWTFGWRRSRAMSFSSVLTSKFGWISAPFTAKLITGSPIKFSVSPPVTAFIPFRLFPRMQWAAVRRSKGCTRVAEQKWILLSSRRENWWLGNGDRRLSSTLLVVRFFGPAKITERKSMSMNVNNEGNLCWFDLLLLAYLARVSLLVELPIIIAEMDWRR